MDERINDLHFVRIQPQRTEDEKGVLQVGVQRFEKKLYPLFLVGVLLR